MELMGRGFTNLLCLSLGWGIGAVVLFFNLKGRRLLPSDHHVRLAATIWPVLIPLGIFYLIYKVFHFGTKEVIVGTVTSFNVVIDTYKHGRLLPAKASAGNDLRPKDEFETEAAIEVDKLLKELE